MNSEKPNFFDSKTIVTMILVGLTFIGWNMYLQRKYPNAYKKNQAPATSETQPIHPPELASAKGGNAEPVRGTEVGKAPEASPVPTVAAVKETFVPVANDHFAFEISSVGMGLRNIRILKYKDRSGETVELGHAGRTMPLETRLLGRADDLRFSVEKINENLFTGHAKADGVTLMKTIEVIPEKYLIQVKVSVTGSDPRFAGLETSLAEEVTVAGGSHFLAPQLEKQEFFVETPDGSHREVFSTDDKEYSWSKVKLASVGSQYFTQAIVDRSPVIPDAKAKVDHQAKSAVLRLQYPLLAAGQDFQIEYSAFIGPKSFSLLHSIDPDLARVVDFGFFNWIARQIFGLLRWFFSLVGNWGVAIICLTLLVRLAVLPINIYSYKSMRAMQVIQPQIQALKEKYKDDQQKQQAEMMRLMRENKVNPLGGCLPILLQFPVFIALYQVLGHSIELYQAPFVLWIHDLSLKDPYYILPVLMGLTMFIQQKTAPNTSMDPAQAKVMMMMPLVFTFFMVSLPSGLTLYMLVGAVFSVVQQMYFVKPPVTGKVVQT